MVNLEKNMERIRIIIIFLLICLTSCGSRSDENYLGMVKKLPKGEYIIKNRGSRHIVSCYRKDGKYYNLNDTNFRINGIYGTDAHQYRESTKIIIK